MAGFYREDAVAPARITPNIAATVPLASIISKRKSVGRSGFTNGNIPPDVSEPIAIIGMSGRFPGARNIDELWTILATGRDMVREIPPERFDWRQYYGDPGRDPEKINSKWCGCLPGVSEFEPLFFEISPKEAETMDPRQRLLLQESWRALEDAGYGDRQLKIKKIGMFVGVEQGDYQLLIKDEGSITSNNNAILAARLAYFLNLSGPVMAIDTACSSGLVAAHQAVLSLRNDECDTAIAAGVNLILTPSSYLGMSRAGMLSEDGKCYAFDRRANGMVPGEAVAVVILKRLSRAEADGDPIYAVIRGSGINYDGKTNGITAPSGVSQTNLLKTVYDQYQVNPEGIQYIIAHGTGTKLGDPVEINALYDAFKDYTAYQGALGQGAPKQGYCALTSTKTNFGHTFAASGLVSLISLVQALRHETIPASLHCEQENEYINWRKSPFYVNKANKPWPAENGKTRTGAVSAFGMSGTNAHIVVQSYSANGGGDTFQDEAPCYLVALSAKTGESLAEKITDLIDTLQNKDSREPDLAEISYTLLEGRQHFSHRCAVVVQGREDAVSVLQQADQGEKLPNLFQGKVPRDFKGQKAIEQYVQDLLSMSWNAKGNKAKYQEILYALADFYCQGYQPDWQQLYEGAKPRRIHLPAYPFIKEQYWLPEANRISSSGRARDGMTLNSTMAVFTGSQAFHPLLHQNTSSFAQQRFSSTFTGEEFFLKDHIVKGQRVMPGVAYLEMARAAVEAALDATVDGVPAGADTGIRLKNVIWARPIVVDAQPVRIHIGLFPEENGEITFEIYSVPDEGPTERERTEPMVYCQGRAVLNSVTEIPLLDLNTLRVQCCQNILSAAECYENFKKMGFQYGLGFQGIEKVHVGYGQVLAELSLPSAISNTQAQYHLHPSLLDAGLQAAIGIMSASNSEDAAAKPSVPFALQELEILDRCVSKMWAWIRSSGGIPTAVHQYLQKIDIDLCDPTGKICVRIKGFSSRILEDAANTVGPAATIGTLMVRPHWQEQLTCPENFAPAYVQQLVILVEMGEISLEDLETEMKGIAEVSRCISLQSKLKGLDKRFEVHVNKVFQEIQNILLEKTTGKALIQVVIPVTDEWGYSAD